MRKMVVKEMEEEKIVEEPTEEIKEENVDTLNLEDDFIEVVGDSDEVINEIEEEVK